MLSGLSPSHEGCLRVASSGMGKGSRNYLFQACSVRCIPWYAGRSSWWLLTSCRTDTTLRRSVPVLSDLDQFPYFLILIHIEDAVPLVRACIELNILASLVNADCDRSFRIEDRHADRACSYFILHSVRYSFSNQHEGTRAALLLWQHQHCRKY